MRGTRARKLKQQARMAAKDGSVIASHEYKRLKKSYNNPSYAPVVVMYPTSPGTEIAAKRKKETLDKKKSQ